jgi:1-acyl-sn-glycerol-3-phosphate acyltransferase
MIPIGMHENFDVLPKFSIFPNFKKISVAVGNSIQIPKTSRKCLEVNKLDYFYSVN